MLSHISVGSENKEGVGAISADSGTLAVEAMIKIAK